MVLDEVLLEDLKVRGECCLFVSLLTDKHFNQDAFKQTLKKIWRLVKKVWFKELGAGLLLAEFEDKAEKERIQREAP